MLIIAEAEQQRPPAEYTDRAGVNVFFFVFKTLLQATLKMHFYRKKNNFDTLGEMCGPTVRCTKQKSISFYVGRLPCSA